MNMKKTTKIILLTIFISVMFNRVEDHDVKINFNKKVLVKSNIVDIKTASKVIKSTVRPVIKVVEMSYESIHSATWYNSHGRNTASGQMFHKDSLTAAYNNAKFGTYLKVTNIDNGKSIIVKVTDRMGNKSSNKIDLSLCAFDSIAEPSSGRLKVKIKKI